MPIEQFIFTDRKTGTGFEPNRDGYQVKACSPGVDATLRRALGVICTHYGDVVYRQAPRAAIERETRWREGAQDVSTYPEEIFGAFPVIWTYDRLRDETYALTQIRYCGLTHARDRFGNFFAHALVFEPARHRGRGLNPLALRRTGLLRSSDPSDETVLPSLEDLASGPRVAGAEAEAEAKAEAEAILREPLFADHLAALISALSTATSNGRPVLVCLSDWEKASLLVEALLDLLPAGARSRTTFCTYEGDRSWVPARSDGTRPPGLVAAHQLIVLCRSEGRSLELRADEYKSVFTVFNFADNQFSDPGKSSAFATFAAECVREQRTRLLRKVHALIEDLELDGDPSAWDRLVPAANLADDRAADWARTVEAIAVLEKAADSQGRAEVALRAIRPRFEQMIERGAAEAAKAAASCALLVDRSGSAGADAFISACVGSAAAALARWEGRAAVAALQAAGRGRDGALDALIEAWSRAGDAAPVDDAEAPDREQALDLLLEGLEKLQTCAAGGDAARPGVLLVRICRAAAALGLAPRAWARLEASARASLADPWDKAKEQAALELSGYFTPEAAPEASVQLNLRLLEAGALQGDALLENLKHLASAAGRSADSKKLTAEVGHVAEEKITDSVERSRAFGHMAEASCGSPGGDYFFAEYMKLAGSSDARAKLRRRLAAEHVVRVLSRELFEELTPWGEGSGEKLRSWSAALKQQPLFDTVCAEAARRARAPDAEKDALPLAKMLWSQRPNKQETSKPMAELWEAVALRASLDADSAAEWMELVGAAPAGVGAKAVHRMQVVGLIGEVAKKARADTWSIGQFPIHDPGWSRVAELETAERKHVVSWALDMSRNAGVTTPREAERLVEMMDVVGLGSPGEIAGAVVELTAGRDPVTCVLVATALASAGNSGRQGPILAAVLEQWGSKDIRKLLEAHLAHRFGRSKEDERGLRAVCERAGLAALAEAAPRGSKTAARRSASGTAAKAAADAGADTATDAAAAEGGLLGWVRQFLGVRPRETAQTRGSNSGGEK